VPIPSQPIPGSPTLETDEKAVLSRIAEGDVAALGILFDQNARSVYSLAMHLLRNHDKAEDVVEETLWQAWQKSVQLVDEADMQSWLLSAGKRRLLEQSPQSALELSKIEGPDGELVNNVPDYPINPGRAAGIRSRLISRASADTDRRSVAVATSAASRVKPPTAQARSSAPATATREQPVERSQRDSSPRAMSIVAGVAALIAVGAVIQMMRANSEVKALRATIDIQRDTTPEPVDAPAPSALEQDKIVAGVTGPDVKVISLTHYGARGAVAKMFWNRESNTWTLVTYSIRQPRPEKIFQVWLSTSGGTLPAGTFVPDSNGRAIVQSTNAVGRDGLYSISVTEEGKGGAPAPSGPAVIAGAP
jgi:DNA-directed RNA polymerase specialized sigma24 family protein